MKIELDRFKTFVICLIVFFVCVGIPMGISNMLNKSKAETTIFNNGIHEDDGGHWRMCGASNEVLYFQCEKCYDIIIMINHSFLNSGSTIQL